MSLVVVAVGFADHDCGSLHPLARLRLQSQTRAPQLAETECGAESGYQHGGDEE